MLFMLLCVMLYDFVISIVRPIEMWSQHWVLTILGTIVKLGPMVMALQYFELQLNLQPNELGRTIVGRVKYVEKWNAIQVCFVWNNCQNGR